MENRLRRLSIISLASALLAGFSSSMLWAETDSSAQTDADVIAQIVTPDLQRRVVSEDDIDSQDFEVGAFFGVLNVEDFGSNAVVGATLAYHISEDFFMEAAYGQSTLGETSFEILSGSAPLLTDEQRDLTYYNLSVGYNIFPGEVFISNDWAFNSSFYIIAGAGNTDFADESHMTYNFGAGYRLVADDWLALRVDVRDYIWDHDLFGENVVTNNLALQIGATVFF